MSKSNSRKATSVIAFRVTPEEALQLRAMAKTRGIGPSSFARQATFRAAALAKPAYEAKTPNPYAADLHKALSLIGRMASNINQIAKQANALKQAPESRFLKVLQAEIRALRLDLVNNVLKEN